MFVRIQFLRFIYSIADNHSNRYLLLSDQDVVSLRKIAGEFAAAAVAAVAISVELFTTCICVIYEV